MFKNHRDEIRMTKYLNMWYLWPNYGVSQGLRRILYFMFLTDKSFFVISLAYNYKWCTFRD